MPRLYGGNFPDTIASQKQAARETLSLLAGDTPTNPADAEAMFTVCPESKIAELTLKQIEKTGGKVDVSLISALSNASKLHDIMSNIPQGIADPKLAQKNAERHRDYHLMLATLADEMVARNLVELPIVTRERGMGR
jgi:hypothetical protein